MRILILTDHSRHSSENSLYSLAAELVQHKEAEQVDVASRKTKANHDFFNSVSNSELWVTTITDDFKFSTIIHPLDGPHVVADPQSYDFVWLRMPPPLNEIFLQYLAAVFIGKIVINNPTSIFETGSKAFLLNFQEVCPSLQLCHTVDDIQRFSEQFPIVLKPLNEYGGKGIWKIENNAVSNGTDKMTLDAFLTHYQEQPTPYLAVKFLKNVKLGDKRIIVIDGHIMGASLRLPTEDSWFCNVAMGGSSHFSEVSPEEVHIVETIHPILDSKGIVMYGVDTLVSDDGKRVLSEINTTSIGGLPQIAQLKGLPLVERGVDLIVQNVLTRSL